MLHDENETHELPDMNAAYAKARDWKPDIVLLGLEVIESQGPEVFRQIAAEMPGARVVLIAEPGQDALPRTYLSSGAHGVLTKPFTVEGVRRKVDAMLGRATDAIVQLKIL
jgi:DNA-binding response OmpR family regulator